MKRTVTFWRIVSKTNQYFFPVLLGLFLLTSAVGAKTLAPAPAGTNNVSPAIVRSAVPTASFKNMRISYDVMSGGVKGMRIYTSFEVYNMKGTSGWLALYFQYRDGTSLTDKNNKFNSTEDTVAVYGEINPAYNPTTVYNDFELFMPYSELDLEDGNYDLTIAADVIYKQGGRIGHLTDYDIVYKQGDTTKKKDAGATLGRIWVDYDVREGGRKGMRVHVKFTVVDMKGVDGRLAIYFQKKNGDLIYSNNSAYRSAEKNGQLALYFDISPGFQTTVYEDASVFLPYTELNLRGTHDLAMDVDVIRQNGNLIQHLAFEDFWYERN